MKTIIQKNDGRFTMFNLVTDAITDVDLLIKVIRAAENDNSTSFTENETQILTNILEECEYIARVKQSSETIIFG